jgi:hypothetical protein
MRRAASWPTLVSADRGRGRLAVACFLAAAAVLACGAADGAAAARTGGAVPGPGWRVRLMGIPPLSVRFPFVLDLTADSPADAWGDGFVKAWPLIDHWNGTRWQRVTLRGPVARLLGSESAVGPVSASPGNVWIFGETSYEINNNSSRGIWLHFDGSRWTWGKVDFAGSAFVGASLAVGRHAVWAFTSPGRAGAKIRAWYHDRGGWTGVRLPGPRGEVISAAATASDLWVLETHMGGGPRGDLLGRAHGRWRLIALPPSMRHSPVSGVIACGRDCALVGGAVTNREGGTTPAVVRWTGRAWTVSVLPAPTTAGSDAVASLATAGPDGLLLATSRGTPNYSPAPVRLWQYWHGHWTRVRLTVRHHPIIVLEMAAIPHTTSVWATAGYANHFKFALISRLP